jgi:hypothetical protein
VGDVGGATHFALLHVDSGDCGGDRVPTVTKRSTVYGSWGLAYTSGMFDLDFGEDLDMNEYHVKWICDAIDRQTLVLAAAKFRCVGTDMEDSMDRAELLLKAALELQAKGL